MRLQQILRNRIRVELPLLGQRQVVSLQCDPASRGITGDGRTASPPYYEYQLPASSVESMINNAIIELQLVQAVGTFPPGVNVAKVKWIKNTESYQANITFQET